MATSENRLPTGFAQVDAVLTSQQAFIVRRWAKAAEAKVRAARAAAIAVDSKNRIGKPLALQTQLLTVGQRCKVMATGYLPGSVVVVAKVWVDTRTVFAHQDKPVTYKLNRNKRRVVDSDPRSIQTAYSMDDLQALDE